jgi:uncharacterized membrane protein YdjX (TVP38/TMEM64 family)
MAFCMMLVTFLSSPSNGLAEPHYGLPMHRLPVLSHDGPSWRAMAAGLAAASAIVWAVVAWVGAFDIDPANLLRGHLSDVTAWHMHSPLQVLCVFCGVFCLMSALAIPGCSVLALGAGAVFGASGGTFVVTLASAAGASLSFAMARRFARPALRRRYSARLDAIDAGLARDGTLYLFTLRLAPVVPYALLNPMMGVTSISAWTFFWVSAVGMLAGSAMYAMAGAGLAQWSQPVAAVPSVGLFMLLALLAALPWGWRWLGRWLCRRRALPRQGRSV